VIAFCQSKIEKMIAFYKTRIGTAITFVGLALIVIAEMA
jgi:hypothetical protein